LLQENDIIETLKSMKSTPVINGQSIPQSSSSFSHIKSTPPVFHKDRAKGSQGQHNKARQVDNFIKSIFCVAKEPINEVVEENEETYSDEGDEDEELCNNDYYSFNDDYQNNCINHEHDQYINRSQYAHHVPSDEWGDRTKKVQSSSSSSLKRISKKKSRNSSSSQKKNKDRRGGVGPKSSSLLNDSVEVASESLCNAEDINNTKSKNTKDADKTTLAVDGENDPLKDKHGNETSLQPKEGEEGDSGGGGANLLPNRRVRKAKKLFEAALEVSHRWEDEEHLMFVNVRVRCIMLAYCYA
jgi:hypothetical protein